MENQSVYEREFKKKRNNIEVDGMSECYTIYNGV